MIKVVCGSSMIDAPWTPSPLVSPVSSLHYHPHQFPLWTSLRKFLESSVVYTHELWVFATCPALRGSTVSYAGVAHVSKNCLEYSMNFWSQSKKN